MRDYASKEALLNQESSLYRKPRVKTGPRRGRWFLRLGFKIAGYGFFLGTVFTLGYWGWQMLEALPYLMVREVILEGSKHVNAAELANRAGITPRQNLLTLDLNEVRLKVMQNPWVEEAIVRRRLPQTVIITVREREPLAVIEVAHTNKRFLISAQGVVLEEAGPGKGSRLPLISGINPSWAKPGKILPYENLSQFLSSISKIDLHQPELLGHIQEIRLLLDGTLSLKAAKLTAPLYIKAENFVEQWPLLLQFLEEQGKSTLQRTFKYEYIDLRFAGKVVTKPYQGRTPFEKERPRKGR